MNPKSTLPIWNLTGHDACSQTRRPLLKLSLAVESQHMIAHDDANKSAKFTTFAQIESVSCRKTSHTECPREVEHKTHTPIQTIYKHIHTHTEPTLITWPGSELSFPANKETKLCNPSCRPWLGLAHRALTPRPICRPQSSRTGCCTLGWLGPENRNKSRLKKFGHPVKGHSRCASSTSRLTVVPR